MILTRGCRGVLRQVPVGPTGGCASPGRIVVSCTTNQQYYPLAFTLLCENYEIVDRGCVFTRGSC